MEMYECRRGMLVEANFRGSVEIARVENPKIKKVTLMRANGEQWDFYPSRLKPAPDGATFDLKVEEADNLPMGAAIMFTDGPRQGAVYVITGPNRGSGYQAAKLFGDGGKYVYSVSPTTIREASHEDVAEYLLARANRS